MIILEAGEHVDTLKILPSFTIFLHDESLLLTHMGEYVLWHFEWMQSKQKLQSRTHKICNTADKLSSHAVN